MLASNRKFSIRSNARWANCVFATMQAAIALLVLWSLVDPPPALAANPDLETALSGSLQRIEKLDYRLNGRLTRVEADGKRTNHKFVAKARVGG